jgi:hypothetical protein
VQSDFLITILSSVSTVLTSKRDTQGILLAATAVDALGQPFPPAYAVVGAENNEDWLWMLQHLHRVVENQGS